MARILIADDNSDYLAAFSDGMEALGHTVKSVATGREALPIVAAGEVDIAFLDVVMSGGGAISILHELRVIDSELPVVIITGRQELLDSPVFVSGLRLAQAKLPKTAPLSELDRVVRLLVRT